MTNQKSLIEQSFVKTCEKLKSFDKKLNDNFSKMTTNFDRFKFVSCIGFMHSELDGLFERESFEGKNDSRAGQSRKEGNESYKEKKFFEAIMKYNESIRYASYKKTKTGEEVNESDNDLALAYANRSAVFFHFCCFDLGLNLNVVNLFIRYRVHQERLEVT